MSNTSPPSSCSSSSRIPPLSPSLVLPTTTTTTTTTTTATTTVASKQSSTFFITIPYPDPQLVSNLHSNADESADEQLLSEYLGRFHRLRLDETTLPSLDGFVLKSTLEKLQELASNLIGDFPILASHVFSPISPKDDTPPFFIPLQQKLFHFYQQLSIELATYEIFLKNTWKSILSDALSVDLPDTEADILQLPNTPSPKINDSISTPFPSETGPLLWTELVILDHALSDLHSGVVTCIAAKTYLAVGTSHGIIHVFNESQQLEYSLDGKVLSIPLASISSIAFSNNEDTLVSGHNDGTLCLWNLNTRTLIAKKLPIKSMKTKPLGHVKGSKILHLTFVGSSSKTFISSDNFGVAFYHTCVSTYLGSIETKAFFGTYQNRLNRQHFTTILAMVSLDNSCVAILTPYKMAILDTQPIRTLYRLLRVNSKAPEDPDTFLSGSLTYCSPYLCMAWANWIRIYKLDIRIQGESKFDFNNVFENEMQAPICCMQKLDNYLVLLDHSKHFTFFSFSQLATLETVDAPFLIGHDDLRQVSHKLTNHSIPNYSRCWTCSLNYMYTFDMHCIARGDLLSFESRVLALAHAGKVSDAIQLSLGLYYEQSTSYAYASSSSSSSSSSKHLLDLVPFLCSMTLHCLNSNQFHPENHLSQLVHFLLAISADSFLFSDFYTHIQQTSFLNLFHSIMIQSLQTPSSRNLTPSFSTPFLQSLIDSEKWTEYETLLSYMNFSMIDIDKQMQICQEHQLFMGLLYLYALKQELERGLNHVWKLAPKIPFEFIFQECSRHLFDSAQQSELLNWAQLHWIDVFQYMVPNFAFNYVKALFHYAPSCQRSSIASSLMDLLDCNKSHLPFILIELILVHTFKSHPDQFVLSSERLHNFFMEWTTLSCIPTDLPLDKFQEGFIYLLEKLFFVPEQITFQQVLEFARAHQFWLVAEYVYTQLQQYSFLLDCYVFDLSRSHLTFLKFPSILQLCKSNKDLFWDHAVELSPSLLNLNPIQFALMLNEFKPMERLPLIFQQFQQAIDPFSVLPFLDTLSKFSPSLLNAETFLFCFECHAKKMEDELCTSLLETHGSQFSFWDKFETICLQYHLNLCLSYIYEHQGKWKEALSQLLTTSSTSFQLNRLFTFCQRHESAWTDVIQWYLSSSFSSSETNSTQTVSTIVNSSTDLTDFLMMLPNPNLLIQSLASFPWTSDIKRMLQVWSHHLQFKEQRFHLLTQLQYQERLNGLHHGLARSQGTLISSTHCHLCHASQVDLIWTSCGHVFHQQCYDRYYPSLKHIEKVSPKELCAQCERKTLVSDSVNSIFSDTPMQNEELAELKHVQLTTDWHGVLTEMLSKAELDHLSDLVE